MEKKTIGALIAALRKAIGMTQRELAEKLHVSDKSISRWERDESAPDLSMIPVLAELFGVTCDELLRGERTSPDARAASPEKKEKRLQWLLASSLTRFYNRSWIAAGIAAAGLLAGAIANLGFLRARVGFFLAAIFYLAAAVCEAIFLNHARLAAADDSLSPKSVISFRRHVIRRAELIFGFLAFLLGFTAPLLTVRDSVSGLTGGWLLSGLPAGGIAVALVSLVLFFIHGILYRRKQYPLAEQEEAAFLQNRRWKRICMLLLLAAAAVTALAHISLTQIWGPFTVMQGTVFHDYESFQAYMEQEIPAPASGPQAPAAAYAGAETYYDESGNVISREEALRETLEYPDGTTACEYIRRNEAVVSIQYTPKEHSLLPITVYTYDDLAAAEQAVTVRHILFSIVYCVEVGAALLLYRRKRLK